MQQHKRRDIIKGIILAIAGYALFSMSDVSVKLLSGNYNPFQILWGASVISIPVLVLISPWTGGLRNALTASDWKLHILRGVLILVAGVLSFYGLSVLPMAKVYTLFFCSPFIITLLSIPLFKEHVGWHRWAAVAVGFSGVLVALRPGFIPLDLASAGILVAAVFFSMTNLLVKFMGHSTPLLSFAIYSTLARVVLLAPVAFTFAGWPSAWELVLFLICGILGAVAIMFVAMAFRHAPSSVAAPFHYTQIIWAVTFGYLFFGDIPDGWTVAGAAIIIASGLYLIHKENVARKE